MLSARRRARGPVGAKVTALPAPGSLNALEPGTAVRELGAPSSAEGVDGKRSPAAELAMQDPELAARIVRGWLLEGRP